MASKRERRRLEKEREKRGRRNGRILWWAGGVLLAALLAFVVVAGLTPDSSGTFPIVAYQGEELLGGREVEFADLIGTGQPVVLNFWAGQCPPCRAEMPAFQRQYEAHKDEFLLVGVDVGRFTNLGTEDDARRLLGELNITYPAAFARNAALLREYNATAMPTTVFFAGDGTVVDRHVGFLSEADLASKLEALLASG